MKLNSIAAAMIAFCFVSSIGPAASAVEIVIGKNHLVCANRDFGTFDLTFTVLNIVSNTEFYKGEGEEPVPAWETLESEMTNLEFTSGTMLEPSGTKGALPGASLTVSRNVLASSANKGSILASLSIPKSLGFLMESLLIDHAHPDKYGTDEIGAQGYSWIDGKLVQIFFACR